MSLFGWREKRRIEDLEDRLHQHRRSIARLEEKNEDPRATVQGQKRVISLQADEVRGYRKQVDGLGQMLTREVAEAVDDVAAAELRAGQYAGRLRRALKACVRYRAELAAQYRVSDFLSEQFIHSVSGDDPRPRALADAVKASEVTS